MCVDIMLCVNDERGNFTGQCDGFDVIVNNEIDMALSLESPFWPPATTRVGHADNTLRVSKRTFPILRYQSYVGNIMWDCATLTPETACDLLNYLASMKIKDRPKWRPDNGWTNLFEKFKRGEWFTPKDFDD